MADSLFKKISLFVSTAILVVSCKQQSPSGEILLPNSIGRMGEIAVVADLQVHNGVVGQALDSVFSQPQPYFFNIEEYFHTYTITSELFKGVAKSYHSIIVVKLLNDAFNINQLPEPYNKVADSLRTIQDKDTVAVHTYLRKNVWAYPQQVMFIFAKNQDEMYKYLLDNRKALRDKMLGIEIDNFGIKYADEKQDSIGTFLAQNYGFTLSIPLKYRVAKFEKKGNTSFAWIRKETNDVSQGLLIYSQPYTRTEELTTEEIILRRDSICKVHIPGAAPGSYMATEKEFPFESKVTTFKDAYAVEIRALWKTENDFMGGPFYSVSLIDTKANRIITLEGFVHSPKYDKTQYIRQLEAIIKTFGWVTKR